MSNRELFEQAAMLSAVTDIVEKSASAENIVAGGLGGGMLGGLVGGLGGGGVGGLATLIQALLALRKGKMGPLGTGGISKGMMAGMQTGVPAGVGAGAMMGAMDE